jgi:hypothetical protein
MIAKLAALLHSKIALAIIGAMFVAGTGAVVATATGATSYLPNAFFAQNGGQHAEGTHTSGDEDATKTAGSDQQDQSHEREGKITAIAAAGSSFTLTSMHSASEDQGDGSDEHGTPTAESTPKATATTTSLTVTVTATTKYEGAAKSFADLKVGMWADVNGATQSDGSVLAATVEMSSGNDGDNDEDDQQQENGISGAVVTVGATSFTVKGEQSTITVTVSNTTTYEGVKGIADLKAGMHVEVVGMKQSTGSIAAQHVKVGESEHSGD